MSTEAVEFTAKLLSDPTYSKYKEIDIARAVELQAVSMRYEPVEALPTKSTSGDVYLDFATAGDRKWIDSDFVLYDADYVAIVPDTTDAEKGRFSFLAEPSLPVTITANSYCPYNAAADLLLARAGGEAGDLVSFSTQGGSFGSADTASSLRSQAAAFRRRGRKSVSI